MAKVNNLINNASNLKDHPEVAFPLSSESEIRKILKEGIIDVMKKLLEEKPLKKYPLKISKKKPNSLKSKSLSKKLKSISLELKDLTTSQMTTGTIFPVQKKQKKNVHDFALPDQIDQAAISLTFNPKSNGWCGFCVFAYLKEGGEDQFPLVKKKMLAMMATHSELYEQNFGMDSAEVTKVIAFGSDIDPAIGKNITYCSSSMWFSVPDCAQIIADAYNEPVCVYSDDRSILPITFLSLHDRKLLKRKPLPMVLHHVHGCHWTTIKVKPHVHLSWPEVNALYFDAVHRGSIPDCFSTS
ncbi:hypothetical protein PHYBLDRAFT_170191 [Phycomyces blakesleeanus NRRL 1555(-)]|uniref:OTU domain-containing protein n=1 Tax=Phycomyces blakesleeanus (strain ATCC 8743b / DSM 1359 / FGSC 10004 / NBRC 33097 / NRRL 1555) TaxID=763407 RepID=A0A162TWG0_PHYB8|nr:hypothetical protein PHYBLDRAFT_170191 [Phycomyces blakesleeanus NRRL 1555(-)]OAD71522.1 hypothetical protein PHYBLDRAFT_170191 [Phycomyces blakesleeanus NRRL 1555(-)]|eukprot:XP_018289562.1 hypothetical protein PHYBLDRAFT_170191 [Phycomyces blakesleeanus NRRL 1555(-)]